MEFFLREPEGRSPTRNDSNLETYTGDLAKQGATSV